MAVEGCEGAAPIDVGDKQDSRAGVAGDGHVDDVAVAQVRLGRAARPLGDHEFQAVAEPGERTGHDGPEAGLALAPGEVGRATVGASEAHDLGTRVGERLEEDGVHVDVRLHARGTGLERLRPADFAAIGRDGGVVGHVLALEGGDGDPAPPGESAEGRREQRLADTGAGALHHEDACAHSSNPGCAPIPRVR